MKYILIILVATMLNIGCSTVIKSGKELAEIAIVNDQMTSGQVTSVIKQGNLSDIDIQIIDHAVNNYSKFASKWKKEVTTLDSTTPLFSEFMSDYTELVSQYKSVETVITKNWESYPLRYQTALLDYQSRARKVNASVDSLLTAAKTHEAILNAIILAKILAGIALK